MSSTGTAGLPTRSGSIGIGPAIADRIKSSPSRTTTSAPDPSHNRSAWWATMSNTGCRSSRAVLTVSSTSVIAVWRSRAASRSLNNLALATAIAAWSAKACSVLRSSASNGRIWSRLISRLPIQWRSLNSATVAQLRMSGKRSASSGARSWKSSTATISPVVAAVVLTLPSSAGNSIPMATSRTSDVAEIRRMSPSLSMMVAWLAPHSRAARPTIPLKTASRSPGLALISFRTSLVAVWSSSDSDRALLRSSISRRSRALLTAIVAWSVNDSRSAIVSSL